ncbi:MAG: hypothetical protein COA78_14980 [Blastopirellula sp.]|nr:MAG: hypothetical protein COA78_14980 [Blastopirellula sp.]
MLIIKKPVKDIPCFVNGTYTDCFLVQFKDGSFSGVLCWDALLDALKRKSKEEIISVNTEKKNPQ